MTYTTQTNCLARINVPDNPDPQTSLIKSLSKLYAELDDLDKTAKKFFTDKGICYKENHENFTDNAIKGI